MSNLIGLHMPLRAFCVGCGKMLTFTVEWPTPGDGPTPPGVKSWTVCDGPECSLVGQRVWFEVGSGRVESSEEAKAAKVDITAAVEAVAEGLDRLSAKVCGAHEMTKISSKAMGLMHILEDTHGLHAALAIDSAVAELRDAAEAVLGDLDEHRINRRCALEHPRNKAMLADMDRRALRLRFAWEGWMIKPLAPVVPDWVQPLFKLLSDLPREKLGYMTPAEWWVKHAPKCSPDAERMEEPK